MGNTKSENTHKHRNLIDDLLDGAMALLAIAYFLASDTFDFHLNDKTLALIGTAGATLRVTARKILMRLWSDKLGVTAGAGDAQPAAVASSGPESED
jgi:hypothetical protein